MASSRPSGCARSRYAALLGLSLAALPSGAQAQAQPPISAAQRAFAPSPDAAPATIVLSEQFLLESRHTGQAYLIQVAFPLVLTAPDEDAAFPVLYVLDGEGSFGLFSSATRSMMLDGSIPPAFIVAVGSGATSLAEFDARRQQDYVHVVVQDGPASFGGGGAAFEAFLMEELRPHIERRLAVDPQRSYLAGHSLGGLFTATVLANDPDAFDGYLIGSPSVPLDPDLIGRIEEAASGGAGGRVLVGVGEREADSMVQGAEGVSVALSGAESGFDVRHSIFPDESHNSVMAVWATAGLRHLLGRRP